MDTELNFEEAQCSGTCHPDHKGLEQDELKETSFDRIFKELKDFICDNKIQLLDIQQILHKTNNWLEQAEWSIDEVETTMQPAFTLLEWLVQQQNAMEPKLTEN